MEDGKDDVDFFLPKGLTDDDDDFADCLESAGNGKGSATTSGDAELDEDVSNEVAFTSSDSVDGFRDIHKPVSRPSLDSKRSSGKSSVPLSLTRPQSKSAKAKGRSDASGQKPAGTGNTSGVNKEKTGGVTESSLSLSSLSSGKTPSSSLLLPFTSSSPFIPSRTLRPTTSDDKSVDIALTSLWGYEPYAPTKTDAALDPFGMQVAAVDMQPLSTPPPMANTSSLLTSQPELRPSAWDSKSGSQLFGNSLSASASPVSRMYAKGIDPSGYSNMSGSFLSPIRQPPQPFEPMALVSSLADQDGKSDGPASTASFASGSNRVLFQQRRPLVFDSESNFNTELGNNRSNSGNSGNNGSSRPLSSSSATPAAVTAHSLHPSGPQRGSFKAKDDQQGQSGKAGANSRSMWSASKNAKQPTTATGATSLSNTPMTHETRKQGGSSNASRKKSEFSGRHEEHASQPESRMISSALNDTSFTSKVHKNTSFFASEFAVTPSPAGSEPGASSVTTFSLGQPVSAEARNFDFSSRKQAKSFIETERMQLQQSRSRSEMLGSTANPAAASESGFMESDPQSSKSPSVVSETVSPVPRAFGQSVSTGNILTSRSWNDDEHISEDKTSVSSPVLQGEDADKQGSAQIEKTPDLKRFSSDLDPQVRVFASDSSPWVAPTVEMEKPPASLKETGSAHHSRKSRAASGTAKQKGGSASDQTKKSKSGSHRTSRDAKLDRDTSKPQSRGSSFFGKASSMMPSRGKSLSMHDLQTKFIALLLVIKANLWSTAESGSRLSVQSLVLVKRVLWFFNRTAFSRFTRESEPVFVYLFLLLFPRVISTLNIFSPPWTEKCLTFAFLLYVMVPTRNSYLSVSGFPLACFILVLFLYEEGILSKFSFGGRLIAAYASHCIRMRSLLNWDCLVSISTQIVILSFLGNRWLVQWLIFVIGCQTLTLRSDGEPSSASSSQPLASSQSSGLSSLLPFASGTGQVSRAGMEVKEGIVSSGRQYSKKFNVR